MKQPINSFNDACEALKISSTLPDVSSFPEDHRKSQLALYQLSIIAKAINKGWVPDWNDYGQRKWYPWFEANEDKSSGFGFSGSFYVIWCTYSHCGSRLCFETEEQAEHVGKTFEALYNDLFSL